MLKQARKIACLMIFAVLFLGLSACQSGGDEEPNVKYDVKRYLILDQEGLILSGEKSLTWRLDGVDVVHIGADTSHLTDSKTYRGKDCYVEPVGTGYAVLTLEENGKKKYTYLLQVTSIGEACRMWVEEGENLYGLSEEEKEGARLIKESISHIISEDMSVLEKVKAVHDYLCMNNTYNQTNYNSGVYESYDHTIAGPMIYHTSVCEGYAEVFDCYMEFLDIPHHYIIGNATGIGKHSWNMVQLEDDQWYHVDTTWDDHDDSDAGINGRWYSYFLMTDAKAQDSRSWNRARYPACKGSKYQDYAKKLNIALVEEAYSSYQYCESKELLINQLISKSKTNSTVRLFTVPDVELNDSDIKKIQNNTIGSAISIDLQRVPEEYSLYTFYIH